MFRSRHMKQLASGVLTAGVVFGILAGPASASASASTAEVVVLSDGFPCKYNPNECPPSPPDTALIYLGGGEANRVSVAAGAQQVRISDPAAEIEPGPGCSRVDDRSVSCAVPRVLVYVATGAGSDSVRSELGAESKLTADGGAGNDLLVGGAGPDVLLAGNGADRLRGRGGDDRLLDASSQEPLRAGDLSPDAGGGDAFFGQETQPPSPPDRASDSFDGGSGTDTLGLQGRRANLRIDLGSRKPVSGARGEHDSIAAIENAVGGAGNDRITGNAEANRLTGDGTIYLPRGKGNDRIEGRGGPDVIEGGEGDNVIRGGPGDDQIDLTRGGLERVSCGSGTDSVVYFESRDFLAPDCEQPRFDFLGALLGGTLEVRSLLPLGRGRAPQVLTGRLGCFLDYVCQVKTEIRVRGPGVKGGTAPPRGTLLGSQSFTIGVREIKSLDLHLSPAGLRRLRRHRALRVSVSLATQHSAGPSSYLTLLRAP